MKILFLNPAAQLGGAERMLIDVMASLREALPAGSSMHLIVGEDGPLVCEAGALGVDVRLLPMPASVRAMGESGTRAAGAVTKLARLAVRGMRGGPALLGYVRSLRAAIGEIKPDVIHSNGIKTHVLSRWLRVGGAKVVWHLHDFVGRRAVTAGLLRRSARTASAVIAISNAVARDAGTLLTGANIHTVVNAIDVNHFRPAAGDGAWLDGLAGFGAPPAGGVVRVGLVATYARWKGHELFLDAAERLLRMRTDASAAVRFYIVGGPIYATRGSQFTRAELQARADRLHISSAVGFVDFQSDPAEVYRALDVVVHASTQPEPFGRTIVEAMACGRAVILSAEGGALEIARPGEDALAFAPGNVRELATRIASLVDNAALRDRLGAAARAAAATKFDRLRLGPALVGVYESVLAPR